MEIDRPTPLLGGLSPRVFMRRHWQKAPLVARGAHADAHVVATAEQLRALAARDGVESRLVQREGERWSVRRGPLSRRSLPSAQRPGWTLLVQGADLHLETARALLDRFRFVPDARLDDVMVSYATDGGGVGPHVDSYDVFLLQLRGRRRWRVAPPNRRAPLRDDVPLKMLARFAAKAEWLLDEGDLLYLPPGWAHDGVAEGETITASIGFRAATRDAVAAEVLQQLLDGHDAQSDTSLRYADPRQAATTVPARVPPALSRFAREAVMALATDRTALDRALGMALSEPKPGVWFDPLAAPARIAAGVALDRRTRMLYDGRHVYLNGEAYRAGGGDAALMHELADRRTLGAREAARLSSEARALLEDWVLAGWVHAAGAGEER